MYVCVYTHKTWEREREREKLIFFINGFLLEEFEGRLWSCTWRDPYGCKGYKVFSMGDKNVEDTKF